MAFPTTNFFTVTGKMLKHLNIWNGYFAALDTAKSDVYGVMNTAGLQDHYIQLPPQIDGFQSQISGWISQWIQDVQGIILDEPFVIDELPIFSEDLDSVLRAIISYMKASSISVQTSVVSLGGSDVDINSFSFTQYLPSLSNLSKVFISRTLDGVNSPGNGVSPNPDYIDVESQLARSCTLYGKCISSNENQEQIQIFGETDTNPSYDDEAEKPGLGPVLANIASSNPIANPEFDDWSGDNAIGWTGGGGVAGTDWEDKSGSGAGPMQLNTVGAYQKQQITGLQRRTAYFFGALCAADSNGAGAANITAKMRMENIDGVTVHKNFSNVVKAAATYLGPTAQFSIYGFYTPNDTVNLDDIYLAIEFDALSANAPIMEILSVASNRVQYFNGLGLVFWNPGNSSNPLYTSSFIGSPPELVEGATGSIAISNNNAGVFQTFFRKAFNVQLPTADSPSVSDSLAT